MYQCNRCEKKAIYNYSQFYDDKKYTFRDNLQ